MWSKIFLTGLIFASCGRDASPQQPATVKGPAGATQDSAFSATSATVQKEYLLEVSWIKGPMKGEENELSLSAKASDGSTAPLQKVTVNVRMSCCTFQPPQKVTLKGEEPVVVTGVNLPLEAGWEITIRGEVGGKKLEWQKVVELKGPG